MSQSDNSPLPSPVPLILEGIDRSKNPKDNILGLLDEVEVHVEKMRKEASKLEEDRDLLLTTLDTLRNSHLIDELDENDKEDIERYIDRITGRCCTVEVLVQTKRDAAQEEALHQVNVLIDTLIAHLKDDASHSKVKCSAYLNSCSSQCTDGATDKIFENAILGCTIDDQKRVKRRLQGLMEYIERSSITF